MLESKIWSSQNLTFFFFFSFQWEYFGQGHRSCLVSGRKPAQHAVQVILWMTQTAAERHDGLCARAWEAQVYLLRKCVVGTRHSEQRVLSPMSYP